MKKIICFFTVFLLSFYFILSVSAVGTAYKFDAVTVTLPDAYTVLTSTNLSRHPDEVERLGGTAAGLKNEFTARGVIFMALDDEFNQIELRCTETSFSKEIVSFREIDDAGLVAQIGSRLMNDYETVTINSYVYLRGSYTTETPAGYLRSVTYVTIENGKLYTFTYFGKEPLLAAEAVSTLRLTQDSGPTFKSISQWALIVVIFLFLAAAVVGAGLLIASLIRDYRRSKNENIVSEYIKIRKR